jgi:hypothetical protein
LLVKTLLTRPNDIADPVAGNVAISFSAALYLTACFRYFMKNELDVFIK